MTSNPEEPRVSEKPQNNNCNDFIERVRSGIILNFRALDEEDIERIKLSSIICICSLLLTSKINNETIEYLTHNLLLAILLCFTFLNSSIAGVRITDIKSANLNLETKAIRRLIEATIALIPSVVLDYTYEDGFIIISAGSMWLGTEIASRRSNKPHMHHFYPGSQGTANNQ